MKESPEGCRLEGSLWSANLDSRGLNLPPPTSFVPIACLLCPRGRAIAAVEKVKRRMREAAGLVCCASGMWQDHHDAEGFRNPRVIRLLLCPIHHLAAKEIRGDSGGLEAGEFGPGRSLLLGSEERRQRPRGDRRSRFRWLRH